MVWTSNQPATSSSLDSLPIRENLDFLKSSLDIHASGSNPHAVTLDQACDQGATTDQAITVSASGSVFNSLLVSDDLHVGGTLRSNRIEYVVYAEHYNSIQDAFDALPHDGGIVMLSSGTIEISSTIVITPLKTLKGLGPGVSLLQLASGSNCNMISGSGHYIHLEGFTLDGNKDNNTSGKGIYFDNVYVGSSIKDLVVRYCAEEGLHFSQCSVLSVINVWSLHNNKDQFLIEDGSESVCFYNCAAEYNATYAGFHFKDTGPNACFGCHTEGCYYGVEIDNSDAINIHNHYVDATCPGSVEAFAAVYIHGGSSNVIAQNVSILHSFSTGQMIFDEDRSYYVPESDIRCSYYSNNQYFRNFILYSSGSTTRTLGYSVGLAKFVFNDALDVQGNVRIDGNVYINDDESAADPIIYFKYSGSISKTLKWSGANSQFEFNDDLDTQSNEIKGQDMRARGILTCNYDYADANARVQFRKPGSGLQYLIWDKTDNRFEFDAALWVDGSIEAAGSGSVFNSLKVDNNLHVYGDLDVEGVFAADHNSFSGLQGGGAGEPGEYYHLKLAEYSALVDGGSANGYHTHPASGSGDGGTKYILLPIDGATLPDDSTGNKSAAVERKKSSAGAPSPHFMQALFDDTTEEFLYWSFRFPGDYGSGLTAKIQYKMATATSGKVDFDVALMAVTPGDIQDVDADSMSTVNSGDETVRATAGHLGEISITITNTDSLVAGDFIVIYLKRDADDVTNDTATGDAEVIGFSLEYTPS